MFEKRDVRVLQGVRRDDAWARAWDWWSRQRFQLSQTGPYRLLGVSFYARIGLRREFDLFIDPANEGISIDLTLNARLTDEGMIAGAVTAAVLLPVAVFGGAISYTEYESDARNLMIALWQFFALPAASVRRRRRLRYPRPCKGCGSALLPDWKVCPYCGRPKG